MADAIATAASALRCHCGAPAVERGNGMEDVCDVCLIAWQVAGEPESCPCPTEPDWLARIRDKALKNAESIGMRRWSDAANFAHGWARGTILIALHELARPEPDVARLNAILMDGYASSEAIRGRLDGALDVLVEVDESRQRMAVTP